MVAIKNKIATVDSRMQVFGPVRQSIEICNNSKEESTFFVELNGPKCFAISMPKPYFTLKPQGRKRVYVEFKQKMGGFVISLNATHKGVINVWHIDTKNKEHRTLVETVNISANAPAVTTIEEMNCCVSPKTPKQKNI